MIEYALITDFNFAQIKEDSAKIDSYLESQKIEFVLEEPRPDIYEFVAWNIADVYLTNKAITKIRETSMPFFIELETYRWREHCGPNYDNDIGYRSQSEYLQWKKKDPITLFERIMLKEKIVDKDLLKSIKKDTELLINKAFEYAKKSPFPDPKDAFKGIFKN